MLISDNGISKVWRDGSWVYKKQPKTRTDNEIYALQHLYDTGYVPYAEQVSIDIIKMEDLGQGESVTDPDSFMKHRAIILRMLEEKGLRHGDLTIYAIIVKNNKPYLIDWGESRTWDDPRPDKRREGDKYWLSKTMATLCP
jgi:serine/threonine-protein kinase RIO1